jgi:hypothetical protein
MQLKKLIPGALLLAAMGTAHAGVDFYGLFDLSYGKNENFDNTSARLHSGGEGDTGIAAAAALAIPRPVSASRAAWTSAMD